MQGNEKLSDEARLVLSKYMIALSSISPNHKVIVHDTVSSKKKWLKANGDPNGNPLAFNDPNIDVIHLHVDLFNNVRRGQNLDVVKHEFVHPIFRRCFSPRTLVLEQILLEVYLIFLMLYLIQTQLNVPYLITLENTLMMLSTL